MSHRHRNHDHPHPNTHTHPHPRKEPLKVKRNNDNLILESDCHRKKDNMKEYILYSMSCGSHHHHNYRQLSLIQFPFPRVSLSSSTFSVFVVVVILDVGIFIRDRNIPPSSSTLAIYRLPLVLLLPTSAMMPPTIPSIPTPTLFHPFRALEFSLDLETWNIKLNWTGDCDCDELRVVGWVVSADNGLADGWMDGAQFHFN